jgi:hypothetical protein
MKNYSPWPIRRAFSSLVILFLFATTLSVGANIILWPDSSAAQGNQRVLSMSRMIKRCILCASLIILFVFSISYSNEKSGIPTEGNSMAAKPIGEVLKEHTKALMSTRGVVGTGQGLCEGKPCIKVFVVKKTPDLDQKIPKVLEGYQVVVVETGEIKALPKNQD